MKQSLLRAVMWRYIALIAISLVLVGGVLAYAHLTVENQDQFILTDVSELPEASFDIVVPGSAVDYITGVPRPVVQSRLDTALEIFTTSTSANRIIVSGYEDTVLEDYNEPEIMRRYLEEAGVPSDSIVEDATGDNSYLTCDFLTSYDSSATYIVTTQDTHLPRMLYLCRAMGLDMLGYEAPSVDSRRWYAFQTIREAFSNVKALYDIHTR